jgi:hypothetical protein
VKRKGRQVFGFETMEPNQYSTLVRIMLDYLAQPLDRDSGTKLCQDKTYHCVDKRNRHQLCTSREECAQHLYCKHNICLAVSHASRRHHRRSAPGPNGLQLLDLVPNFADFCVMATAASHGDSHLFRIVQKRLVEMPTRMAHDLELALRTRKTTCMSGVSVAMIPVPLVKFGETFVTDGCQQISCRPSCQQINLRIS